MALMTKKLSQNITQYGIQNIFVVDSASHRKTYPNITGGELICISSAGTLGKESNSSVILFP